MEKKEGGKNMTMEHGPEPWKITEPKSRVEYYSFEVTDDNGHCVNMFDFALEEDVANHKRIVACVNACAGIPSQELEQGVKPSLKPDKEWLVRAIKAYYGDRIYRLTLSDSQVEDMAEHILGNWLMVEQKRLKDMVVVLQEAIEAIEESQGFVFLQRTFLARSTLDANAQVVEQLKSLLEQIKGAPQG